MKRARRFSSSQIHQLLLTPPVPVPTAPCRTLAEAEPSGKRKNTAHRAAAGVGSQAGQSVSTGAAGGAGASPSLTGGALSHTLQALHQPRPLHSGESSTVERNMLLCQSPSLLIQAEQVAALQVAAPLCSCVQPAMLCNRAQEQQGIFPSTDPSTVIVPVCTRLQTCVQFTHAQTLLLRWSPSALV